MTSVNPPIVNFSGGIIGKKLHNRVDVESYPKAAEVMTNLRPDPQGTMSRRPPMEYIDSFTNHDKKGKQFPFVFDTEQSYNVLATEEGFDFFIADGRIATDSVTAAIADGAFAITTTDYVDVAAASGSVTASSDNGSNFVSFIYDESSATYWQSNATTTQFITFDLGSAQTIYDLWISARNGSGTNCPTSFTFSGSATGSFSGEEVTVLTVSGSPAWSPNEKRKYRITTPGSYRYYRIRMTAHSTGAGTYQISEMSMWRSQWLDNSAGTGSVNVVGGKCYLDSDGSTAAIVEQKVSINETSLNHVLKFTVDHGPVSLIIGTTSGDDDVMSEVDLGTGTHYLSFVPGASTVFIQFYHDANAGRIIDNVSIVSGTQYRVAHPYTEAQLGGIKFDQIGDRLYLTHEDVRPYVLERRGHRSWSLVRFLPDDGPFDEINTTATQISASATTGEVTLTASDDLFDSSDAGNVIALTYAGQLQSATASSDDIYTEAIKITGIGSASRSFRITILGTFSGTVTLQESSGNANNFSDNRNYTAPTDVNFFDNRDNQTWFYRLAIKPGNFTSGTVSMQLSYGGGSTEGVVRVISVSSPTSAVAEVLEPLAYTGGVKTWRKGAWNAVSGWPAAVAGAFGRLWFGRGITVWGSVSDDFSSFKDGEEADLLVSRKLTAASSRGIRWLAYLSHLCIGTKSAEHIGLGNTSSEPISNSNFKTLPGSKEGCANLQPVTAGDSVVYVHRNLRQVMMFQQNPQALSETSYISVDLTELAPRLADEEIVRIAVQQEPNRRIYAVLKSGKCVEILFRPEIKIRAWSLDETQGRFEDVQVIPQNDEDRVYFIVRRNINGTWKRFIERFGSEEVDCDEDLYHLDSALRLDLTRPDTAISVSGKSGTVTITADEAVFDGSAGDVGKVIWVKGGRATIATNPSTTVLTATWTLQPDGYLDDDEEFVAAPGFWGYGANVSSFSGLDHLEGEEITVYGDMTEFTGLTVSSGSVTLPQPVSIAFAGLPYRSRYKSLKLSYGGAKGTALMQPKAIKGLGVALYRTGPSLKYGPRFTKLRPIDTRTKATPWGEPVKLYSDEKELPFDANWNTDSRLCFEINGAPPATISGVVPQLETRDR